MRIEVCHIGKTKEKWLSSGEEFYLKKCKRYYPVKTKVINVTRETAPERAKTKEAEKIISYLQTAPKHYNILLDERGKMHDSIAFARHLEKLAMHQGGAIRFITGGPFGVTDQVRASVHEMVSFSPMVFTHEMVRVLLLEQLYRAMTILRGESHHHI